MLWTRPAQGSLARGMMLPRRVALSATDRRPSSPTMNPILLVKFWSTGIPMRRLLPPGWGPRRAQVRRAVFPVILLADGIPNDVRGFCIPPMDYRPPRRAGARLSAREAFGLPSVGNCSSVSVLCQASLGARHGSGHNASDAGGRRGDNQPLLWTGPRRVRTLFYSLARLARRVAGHRASSVIQLCMTTTAVLYGSALKLRRAKPECHHAAASAGRCIRR